MTALPPPQLPSNTPPAAPGAGSGGRLRTGAIALVTSTLVIGGLVIGSQFVSANSPSVSTESVDQTDETEPAEDIPQEIPAEETNESESPDEDSENPTFDFENCFFGSGPLDLGSLNLDEIDPGEFDLGDIDLGDIDLGDIDFGDIDFGDIDDILDDLFEGEGEECTSLIPENFGDEFAEWAAFGECVAEQLGFDEGFGHVGTGSVTIDLPSEDGFDFSIYDFGENDGSITIVKNGDNISVSTDGDVSELDDFSFGDLAPEFDAAHEACADLLPEGVDLDELMSLPGGFEIFADGLGE